MIKHGDPKAKPGLRIHLVSMDSEDPNPVDSGLEGTIDRVDDMGTIHVNWDDGRRLGVIPGVDDYQILPSKEDQIKPDEFMDMFNESKGKRILDTLKKNPISKPIDKTFKSAANKNKIKIESEEIEGGKAKGMSLKDLAKKHKVDIKNIEKEIKVGTKIEMEHTESKKIAKEIAMDHIAEFPDYYTNKKHGLKASEKGLEKDLEETTSAGAAGAYNAPLFGKQTTVRKPKAKKLASNIITKGDLKNPLGKIYSLSPKTESKIFKVGDLVNEISSTHATKLRNAEGTFDGDPWVGKQGWLRKDELTWPGGEISDILAKMDINWSDSDLTLTDKETDKINEGWLIKTKEDKLALSILKRVKERYPENITIQKGYRSNNDLPDFGDTFYFTLPGIKREAKINVVCRHYDDKITSDCDLQVNHKNLDASNWAIRKLYWYFYEKELGEAKNRLDKQMQSDLTDPGYAEDVFDMLGDSETMNESKKKKTKESPIHKKKWERCVKDVKKQNKKDGKDYNPYAVCTASIGYEGSIKKPHRKKDKEELEETTTFSSVFGGGFPVTPFMFAKKGKHIPSKKPIWKGGKIVQKVNKADLLGESLIDEINKVKWVKGGKFVKIKDKCAKYNNQPWCSQGAIDDPLELSDTTFENIKKISKKTGIKESEILNKIKTKLIGENTKHKLSFKDRLKIKMAGIDDDKVLYNLNNGLPIDWKGTKEGFYEKMEPKNNNTGSN